MLSHARMFSRPKILFLVSLLYVALLNSIPTYLLNFEFFIILVCLLFIHAKHSYQYFSAGAQNVTGAYICNMLIYRRLLTTCLHGKQLCDSK